MAKPNLHNIFPQTPPYKWKHQQKEGNYTIEKARKNNLLSTNPKEDSHTNIIPPLTTKMTGSNNHFSLISININGLISPIKRHRLKDWICKQDPEFCCKQEKHFSDKDRLYLRVKD